MTENKGSQGKRGSEASYSGQKRKHGKRVGKRNKNNNCFNCDKLGHFACDCIESKVILTTIVPLPFLLVVACCLLKLFLFGL